jgi:hypothetical protein
MEILHITYEVNRIEVGGAFHHLGIFLVLGIDLGALENLGRCAAVRVIGNERAAAGLAFVTDHTAHTQRTVEFFVDIHSQIGIVHGVNGAVGDSELEVHESHHVLQFSASVLAGGEFIEIMLYGIMQLHEVTAEHLLVVDGRFAARVGNHIVYILDEHHCRINVVEVLDKSSVAAGTEHGLAVLAERCSVGVSGYGIG